MPTYRITYSTHVAGSPLSVYNNITVTLRSAGFSQQEQFGSVNCNWQIRSIESNKCVKVRHNPISHHWCILDTRQYVRPRCRTTIGICLQSRSTSIVRVILTYTITLIARARRECHNNIQLNVSVKC